jgi:photosystem II stability/assembly factor-like uncharacterized protein
MFNLRGRVTLFAFDPLSPDTIYANAIGLWRSDDAGQTWNLVLPDPRTVKGVILAGDHGEVTLDTVVGPFTENITALAVDPADSKQLYAAIARADGTTLFVSSDRGASWQRSADLPDGGKRIYVDPRSPQQERTLYVIGKKSIYCCEGGRWQSGALPVDGERLLDIVVGFPSRGPSVAYALSHGSISVSEDGGRKWVDCPLPGETAEFVAVATCHDHPETAYASYRHLQMGDERFFGVLKTSDGGRSWQPVWKENNTVAENIKDIWVTEHLGPYFGEMPFSLGVAPHDPNLCYGTDWARTLCTQDGGRTWQGVYSRKLPDGSYTSTGLDVTNCYGVHFDPFDTQRLFISYTDIGLFRSENGGRGWIGSITGVPRDWINTTYWVVFDPQVKGRMWAVMSPVHDLPRAKMWRGRSPSRYKGGVCRSDDGGKTWRVSNGGMPEMAATHILLDPNSAPQSRTLYATGFGHGVYKSSDGGETWQLKNTGIEGEEPFAWRLTIDSRGLLYLVVARRSEDGRIGGEQDGALYRSTDGGEHWTRLPLPANVNGPNGLSIDPVDPQRLYLAAWSRPVNDRAVGGGIFVSTNGGTSWKPVLTRDQHIYDVTIDLRHPQTLYACGFSSSVWKSTDRGVTWRRLQGYNFKWGQRVIPDPQDAGSIYVTTFGGGLWHGPADGDPQAVEDILTPVLRYARQ